MQIDNLLLDINKISLAVAGLFFVCEEIVHYLDLRRLSFIPGIDKDKLMGVFHKSYLFNFAMLNFAYAFLFFFQANITSGLIFLVVLVISMILIIVLDDPGIKRKIDFKVKTYDIVLIISSLIVLYAITWSLEYVNYPRYTSLTLSVTIVLFTLPFLVHQTLPDGPIVAKLSQNVIDSITEISFVYIGGLVFSFFELMSCGILLSILIIIIFLKNSGSLEIHFLFKN